MTVTEGKQELIAFACVYYAKGMLDDKEYEALKLAIRGLDACNAFKKEISNLKDDPLFWNVSNGALLEVVLEIVDKHFEELEGKNEC